MTFPLVSIVTPFYNSAETLAECIESVLRQTHSNWEYILVDNQSTDGSGRIAQEYVSRFPGKIRLIRTPAFLSQVQNYNFALAAISPVSTYCKIVQADDWIFPECLERMVALAETDPSIGLVSSHFLRGNHLSSHVEGHGLSFDRSVIPGKEIGRLQLLGSLYVFGSPTVVLYRSEVVRAASPFYDERTLHDDTDAHYRILQKWNFGFVHQVLSFLRLDRSSIRGRVLDFHPDILDRLLQVSKFGSVYLRPDEHFRLSREVFSSYYEFLARRRLAGAPKQFWEYHIAGLHSGGLELGTSRLWKCFFFELLRLLVNPGSALESVWRRIRVSSEVTIQSSTEMTPYEVPAKEPAVTRPPSDAVG